MKAQQQNLFTNKRMQMTESIEMTIQSMLAYGPLYDHWAMAWSGGKDSTTLVTLIIWMINAGKIPAPKSISILYADTRMELTPLYLAAKNITDELREYGYKVQEVMAPMEKRFMCYILGRGVPPPSNTFRWCTGAIKVEPMEQALQSLYQEKGQKILMLTGVRQGESAIRDERIVMSCSKDGAECGQGWYQTSLSTDICDTLAPLLHWRVCHVWEWLKHWAPLPEYGDWSTAIIADAYGGDEAEEINARTGCIGCPLASKDKALEAIIKLPSWKYLQPLMKLKPLYRLMKKPQYRHRQPGGERRKDGKLSKNQQRLGPLTLEARRHFLSEILAIQEEVNIEAIRQNRPPVCILNSEEVAFITSQIDAGVYPDKWDGTQPTGDVILNKIYSDGTILPDMFLGE